MVFSTPTQWVPETINQQGSSAHWMSAQKERDFLVPVMEKNWCSPKYGRLNTQFGTHSVDRYRKTVFQWDNRRIKSIFFTYGRNETNNTLFIPKIIFPRASIYPCFVKQTIALFCNVFYICFISYGRAFFDHFEPVGTIVSYKPCA